MKDLIFIGTTILFFVIAIAYVHACEKLNRKPLRLWKRSLL
jgi:hypothetical protein